MRQEKREGHAETRRARREAEDATSGFYAPPRDLSGVVALDAGSAEVLGNIKHALSLSNGALL